MKKDQQYTKIYKLLERCILNDQKTDCKQIESKIYNQPLLLNMLGEEQIFLTDLYSSIQFICRNKNLQQQGSLTLPRDPLNIRQTNYYFINKNKWHPFNSKSQYLSSQPVQNNPYHPKYYFKDYYENLKKEKILNKTYFLPCFRIKITKWRIKIVNISKSGWFAPIIEAIDFKKEQNSVRQDFKSISLVLYQQKMRVVMQNFRLQELRYRKIHKFPYEQDQISLFYFLRDKPQNKISKRLMNMFKADESKQFLKYQKNNKLKYVFFGQKQGIQGLLTLQSSVNSVPIKEERLRFLNTQSLRVLFSNVQINRENEQQPFWSSSDQEEINQEQQYRHQKRATLQQVKRIDQSDSDDQDPLRNLYIKKFGISSK